MYNEHTVKEAPNKTLIRATAKISANASNLLLDKNGRLSTNKKGKINPREETTTVVVV